MKSKQPNKGKNARVATGTSRKAEGGLPEEQPPKKKNLAWPPNGSVLMF
jgi:hypothetical protein